MEKVGFIVEVMKVVPGTSVARHIVDGEVIG
jgi:hypothetical protein